MDDYQIIMQNQLAIMEALSQLLPSGNVVQPMLTSAMARTLKHFNRDGLGTEPARFRPVHEPGANCTLVR